MQLIKQPAPSARVGDNIDNASLWPDQDPPAVFRNFVRERDLAGAYEQEPPNLGPRVSTELLAYGTIGLVMAILSILVYLWFRFEWQFALGAMVANVHDIVLTIGFMSVTQIDFDLTSIAALLTILGYSLNDTVVIYDRIRENLRRYKRLSMPDLLNSSVNSTLSRSIITHVTVTLALLALLLFGGNAIHSFTATMMFGVVLVGTYTSIFIAAPILIYLGVGTGREVHKDKDEG